LVSALSRFPWITAAVCVPAAILLAATRVGWVPAGLQPATGIDLGDALHVVELGARSTALVGDADERWRLVTSHFVHTSWLHLVFNLAFLFPVGGALEQIVRRRDYAVLMLVAMIGSAGCSLVFTPQVSAGASGVVFAVLGAAVVTGIRNRDRLGPHVRHHFGWWVLPFLLITLAVTLGNPSVDHANHVGGLVAGLAYAPFLRLRLPAPVERGSAANVVALAMCAACFVAAPAIARGGAPTRVEIGGGWSAALPAAWAPRFGPLGELEWTTAGGLVVLTVGEVPATTGPAQRRWYLDHRLAPLRAVGRCTDVEEITPDAVMPLPPGALHLRFALRREQTPMVRDVVFLPAQAAGRRSIVVSLEVPRQWAERYDETRDLVVGSLRAPRPGAGVTRISVAAIE
jgi:membrane associated rhomboid family serine protease